MRTLLALTPIAALATLVLVGPANCSAAGRKADPADTPGTGEKAKLKVGDPAPPFQGGRWLKGQPFDRFDPNKVYVLDFWATWCGPCIASMPHLSELAADYADRGLVAVAVTTIDDNNPAEAIEQFVRDRGANYHFDFVMNETYDTDKAYRHASGRDQYPMVFVVGKDGKIAFIGHPAELDDVLPRVLDGTWRGQPDIDEMHKADKQFDAILTKGSRNPEDALSELDRFGQTYPWKAAQPSYSIGRILLLLSAKKGDEAKAISEPLIEKFTARRNADRLSLIRDVWVLRDYNPGRLHLDVGLKAADAVLALQGADKPRALAEAAEAYFQAGDPDKAVSLAERAVAEADNEKLKEAMRKLVKKYKGGD